MREIVRLSVLLTRLATLLAIANLGLVSQAVADDEDTCVKGSGDQRIAACTRVIDSGRLQDDAVAWAYGNRALAYYNKQDYDHAIADFDQVIRINPQIADMLYGRGMSKLRKGDRANGNADIAAARAMQADVAKAFERYGVR